MKRTFPVTSGNALRCRGWRQEGLLRLLENVLSVGEDPDNLVVYAALGRRRATGRRTTRSSRRLKTLETGQTLLVQSGKPIGVLRTHAKAPIVIMANCNIVGQWAKAEKFYELAEEEPDLLGWPHRRRLAIYRLAGRHSGHLRNLHAHRRAAFRRRPRRPLRAHRGPRRHGRRAAARRHDGESGDPMRRGRRSADRQAHGDRLPRHQDAFARRRHCNDPQGASREAAALGRPRRQRRGHLSGDRTARHRARCRHRPDLRARPCLWLYSVRSFARRSTRRCARETQRS